MSDRRDDRARASEEPERRETGAADRGDGAADAHGDPAVGAERARLSRRRLLRAGGLGGAALLGGGVLGRASAGGRSDADPLGVPTAGQAALDEEPSELAELGASDGYGRVAPPSDLDREHLDALTLAPPRDDAPAGSLREYDMSVTAERHEVADGVGIDAWAYGGRVPGPVLRATEGDVLRLRMRNYGPGAHSLHLHGNHPPGPMDGVEPIPEGETFTYEFPADPVGVHPYHCHVGPIDEHVRRGQYGVLIVDPPGGRPPAHEVVLVLGGFDVDGDGRDDLYAFNGLAGAYDRHPIRVPVGERVRCYVANLVAGEAVAGFHLHARTFDVYRSGTALEPDEHTDTISLGMAERAVLEFSLPEPGRYMFHPHQLRLASRGAMGWFAAV